MWLAFLRNGQALKKICFFLSTFCFFKLSKNSQKNLMMFDRPVPAAWLGSYWQDVSLQGEKEM